MMNWLQIALGLGLLTFCADLLVRGASEIARRFGISPLLVGLTVVAYGTSAPELAVSLMAASHGSTDLAYGNIVGSNVANLGLVLGAAALVRPMRASAALLRREIPFLIAATAAVPILAWDGTLSHLDGVLFLAGAVFFTGSCLLSAIRGDVPASVDVDELAAPEAGPRARLRRAVPLVVVGSIGLVAGSHFLVEGATAIALAFHVPEQIIGLSLVAIGTSLPELATSLTGAFRGEGDIALGNVIGSNIFNVLLIFGATATAAEIPVPGHVWSFEVIAMLILTGLLVPFIVTGQRISRIEGGVLLLGYGAFLFTLF